MAPVDRNQGKLKKIFFVLIVIGLFIFIFNKFNFESSKHQKQEKVQSSLNLEESQLNLSAKDISDTQKDLKQNHEPRSLEPCYSMALDQNLQLCDRDCFIKKLKNKNLESAQFIMDGWFDESQPIPKNQKSLMGEFYLALAEMGMLSGNFKVEKDEKLGISRLEGLMYKNPANAVYALFATAYALSVRDFDQARKYKEFSIQNSRFFDSFFVNWSRDLLTASLSEDGLGYSVTLGLRYSAPIPDYLIISNLARSEGGDWFSNWIEYLVDPGIKSDGNLMDINWFPLEYTVGYQLNHLSPQLLKVPHMKDLKGWARDQELSELMSQKNNETCSKEISEQLFKSHLQYLERWLSNAN